MTLSRNFEFGSGTTRLVLGCINTSNRNKIYQTKNVAHKITERPVAASQIF